MVHMNLFRVGRIDALRAAAAGSRAVALRIAAKALFEAGGRKVLPAAAQRAVRGAVEREASRLLGAVGIAERALEGGAAPAAMSAASMTARQAGRLVARGIGAAAAAGAIFDGGWALVRSLRKMRAGTMTGKEAAIEVAREAGTGAAATAAGTATAALLVAVTGGIAAPAVFVVAAAASMGAKAGLDAWLAPAQPSGSYARLGPSQRSTWATVLPFRRA
jgi:hypothetical protein